MFINTFGVGYNSGVLDIISLLVILSGIFVIISKNPVVSLLFLIGLFGGIASYLILLGLSFLGISYLLVYVGAIAILFLFIIMLINIRLSELHSYTSNSIPLAISMAILFNYALYQLIPVLNTNLLANKLYNVLGLTSTGNDVLFVNSQVWDGNLTEVSQIASVGNVLYTNYFVWLLIVSLILLLALVGTIVIVTKNEK